MAIYDNNWKSYAMYTVCTVESGADYGAIENWARAGIGIAQWTYDRSWELLNLMVTDYPSTSSLFPILYSQIQPGTSSWGQRIFSQNECNEISSALVTDEGVATQDKLWNRDCDEMYIPLLRDQCHITDPKTAIFALSVHHQAPNAFWQIYNACGNTDYNTWYRTTLNNGIVGSYTNRQNTIKSLLDQWDGVSPAEGFGTRDPNVEIGGNTNPGAGNPEGTYKETVTKISIKSLSFYGKELVLNLAINDANEKLTFIKISDNNMWLPVSGKKEITTKTEDNEIPNTPDTGTGDDSQRQQLVDLILSFTGSLGYSQAQSLRMNPPGGFADCSGLVWYCYNQVAGIEIGTWTGQQVGNGRLIKEGSGALDTSDLLKGDLLFMNWSYHNPKFDHVEMYIGNNQLSGHGGDPYYGPTTKPDASAYASYGYDWQVRRYI